MCHIEFYFVFESAKRAKSQMRIKNKNKNLFSAKIGPKTKRKKKACASLDFSKSGEEKEVSFLGRFKSKNLFFLQQEILRCGLWIHCCACHSYFLDEYDNLLFFITYN